MPPSSIDFPVGSTLPLRAPPEILQRAPRRSWFARFFLSPFDDVDDRATSRAEGRRAEKAEQARISRKRRS
jgi:hypothetical protein